MTTRSYEGITLGKHLSNIFALETRQVNILSDMICHILGTTKNWNQFESKAQGWRLNRHTSTIFLASTLRDSHLHDCILLISSRDYLEEHLDS